MSYGPLRFLYENAITAASMVSPSSQAYGVIGGAEMSAGTGGASLYAAGDYTAEEDLLYIVQIHDVSGGNDIGQALYRWRTSNTAGGSWEASSVATSTTLTLLDNGVKVAWEAAASGNDLEDLDTWKFSAYSSYSPAYLIDRKRDTFWRSGALEQLTNGGFGSVTTGWGATSCTLDSIAGGESGNCLELTRTGGSTQSFSQTITTTAGTEYILKAYIKSGSSGDEAFSIAVNGIGSQAGTSSSTWTQTTYTFVATGASQLIFLTKSTATAGTMLFDTVSCLERPALRFDLGSAQALTTCILQDHNLTSSAVLKLQGHTSDVWTSPSYTNTISIADPIIEYFTETYQYWRLYVEDDDNTDGYVEFGSGYLGTYLQLAITNAQWGSPRTYGYTTQEGSLASGVLRRFAWARQVGLALQFSGVVTNADIASLVAMQETLIDVDTGIILPLFVHQFSDESDTLFLMDWTNIQSLVRQYRTNTVNELAALEFAEVVK